MFRQSLWLTRAWPRRSCRSIRSRAPVSKEPRKLNPILSRHYSHFYLLLCAAKRPLRESAAPTVDMSAVLSKVSFEAGRGGHGWQRLPSGRACVSGAEMQGDGDELRRLTSCVLCCEQGSRFSLRLCAEGERVAVG